MVATNFWQEKLIKVIRINIFGSIKAHRNRTSEGTVLPCLTVRHYKEAFVFHDNRWMDLLLSLRVQESDTISCSWEPCMNWMVNILSNDKRYKWNFEWKKTQSKWAMGSIFKLRQAVKERILQQKRIGCFCV